MGGRIPNFAKPGSLFKQYTRQREDGGLRRALRQEDVAHLALVRKLPCAMCGGEPCDAAHVRAPSAAHGKRATPIGQKPDDRWALPLCRKHHDAQHRLPEIRFWWDAQISPVKLCMDLYRVSGNLDEMRAVILQARQT